MLDSTIYNRAAVVHGRVDQPGCRARAVHLPPYAPNLNLIERLWRFFKQKTLWNTHYPTLAAFRAAIRAFFADLAPWREQLASLLTARFHLICHKPEQISAA